MTPAGTPAPQGGQTASTVAEFDAPTVLFRPDCPHPAPTDSPRVDEDGIRLAANARTALDSSVERAAVLAQHQRHSIGMTYNSPDRCACGAETMPDRGDEDVMLRRDRAFAIHQDAALAAARAGEADHDARCPFPPTGGDVECTCGASRSSGAGAVEPDQDAEGALREAMTDVLAVAEVDDETAPTSLLASLRDLGWVLTPVRAAGAGAEVDREVLTDRIETAFTDDGHREPRTEETRYVAHVAAGEVLAFLAARGAAAPTVTAEQVDRVARDGDMWTWDAEWLPGLDPESTVKGADGPAFLTGEQRRERYRDGERRRVRFYLAELGIEVTPWPPRA